MIEKIDHTMRARTLRSPLARHPLFFEMLYDYHSDWKVLWWIGSAGPWLDDDRRVIYEFVAGYLDRFERLSRDPDATFPFTLAHNQTRESRYCEELAHQLHEQLMGRVKRATHSANPVWFDFFFLKLNAESNMPQSLYTTLPILLQLGTEHEVQNDIWVGQYLFGDAPNETVVSNSRAGRWCLRLPAPLPWEPDIPLFAWNSHEISRVEGSPQSFPAITDPKVTASHLVRAEESSQEDDLPVAAEGSNSGMTGSAFDGGDFKINFNTDPEDT